MSAFAYGAPERKFSVRRPPVLARRGCLFGPADTMGRERKTASAVLYRRLAAEASRCRHPTANDARALRDERQSEKGDSEGARREEGVDGVCSDSPCACCS